VKLTYTEAAYEVIEAGVYAAKLKQITEGSGEFGDFLRFEWTVLDDGGSETDTTISGLCNPLLNSRSKLSAWAQAHLGEDLAVGQEIDLDGLVGKRVMLTVNVEPRKDGQGDRNRVTAVSPMRKKAMAARPAASTVAPRTIAEPAF
jgi:hypothetical protein